MLSLQSFFQYLPPLKAFLTQAGILAAIYLAGFVLLFPALRKGLLPKGGLRFVTWGFVLVLAILFGLQLKSLKELIWLDRALTVVYAILLWRMFKNFLEGFYVDIWRLRVKKQPVDQLMVDIVKFAILAALVLISVKSVFQIDFGALLTSSAILTAVVGFSMQDSIGSFVSGILIQVEKPFWIGHWIRVANLEGRVVALGWRYTRIETSDKNVICVPNNSISRDILVNYSYPSPLVRQSVVAPAPLEAPPIKVRSALEAAMRRCRSVLQSPRAEASLREIQAGLILYEAKYYIARYDDAAEARDEVQSAIWYEFARLGVSIPSPRQDVANIDPPARIMDPGVTAQLAELPLFAGIRESESELLAMTAAVRRFPPGRAIVTHGERGAALFVVISGRVEVSRDGKSLAELTSGQFFGEMALLTGEPRQADVTALVETTCLEIDRECFRVILERNPELAGNVKEIFSSRVAGPLACEAAARCADQDASTLFERFKRIFLKA
jgi:small-conductance mechanosensitive channel